MKDSVSDPKRKKRVLWLLNHTTLMEFEVKLLVELGFEVFVPKITPSGPNGRTATIISDYDKTLSIPSAELDSLNSFNFYEQSIPPTIARILNDRFGIGFTSFIFPGCFFFTEKFKGLLFLRVFGHAGDMTYELASTLVPSSSIETSEFFHLPNKALNFVRKILNIEGLVHNNAIMRAFYQKKNSFYFAACYENVISHEPGLFKKRGLYLPLGIPDSIFEKENTWRGGNPRILFICPNINEIPYYRYFYDLFVKNFGDLPYAVGGKQSLPGQTSTPLVSDPNIIGFQSRESFDLLMQTCSCLFYHSQEPRHLHYHPLEAIVYGLPVIYLKGGLLEYFGGKDQPGLCSSYEEARSKIERIHKGDQELISSIITQQKKILDEFRYEYCISIWKNNFLPTLKSL